MKDTTKDHHEKRIANYLHLQYIENAFLPESCKRRFKHQAYPNIRSESNVESKEQDKGFII